MAKTAAAKPRAAHTPAIDIIGRRRVSEAYLLKESPEKLWDYRYEGAMLNYLQQWTDQLRWQRLPSFH